MRRIAFFVLVVLGGLGALVVGEAAAFAEGAEEGGRLLTRDLVRQEIAAWQAEHDGEGRVYWKGGGPVFEACGGDVKVVFGGRIMGDFTFFDDADPDLEDALADPFASGFQFRRVWLRMNGQVTPYVGWMVQLAMESPDALAVPFLDVWVRLQNLDKCLGCLAPDLKVGHYQEPIGLAWLTSSKHFQLTAWPLPTTTFTPGYNTGATLHSTGWDKHATAQLGWFLAAADIKGTGFFKEGQALTGRVTGLPWAACDSACRFLHVGAGASYRFDLGTVRFRSRPDLDLGPFVVDTGAIEASDELLVDAETAFVWDRFSVQAEGMWVRVDADQGTDPRYWGWYVQASWLIGAPCRKYDRAYGVFSGIAPCADFDCRGGTWGAVELAVRVDGVNLDDGDKRGGRCRDVVLGANWWFNANARVMVNLVHAEVRGALGATGTPSGDGAVNALVVRFQVHW
jgi:phosphate-selective porin OprO/OprP